MNRIIKVLMIAAVLSIPSVANAQKWKYKGSYDEGVAIVKDAKGKWGFIDEKGKVLGQMWRDVRYFQEDLAPVEDENEKWGFVDRTGTVVIPCQFNFAYWFSEGLAWIRSDDGFSHGFIDKTGTIVIPCVWKDVKSFSNGKAQVKGEDGVEVFIDKTGKIVSE